MVVEKRTYIKNDSHESIRNKINVEALVNALEQHVLGEKEMTATQVRAALALLKKTLPDLSGLSSVSDQKIDKVIRHEDALNALE